MRQHPRPVLASVLLGAVWMVPIALLPLAIGAAIDDGIVGRDTGALLSWVAVICGLGLVRAASTGLLQISTNTMWVNAEADTLGAVLRHATRVGAALPGKIRTGEVVAIGSSDVYSIGMAFDTIGRVTGAVVSFVVVAIALLASTPVLGLVVLVGVPLAVTGLTPLLGPLRRRTDAHRDQVGAATSMAADIVSGLRILRGIGGERRFAERFAETSQRVRAAGIAAGRIDSWLSGIEVLLPGLVTVLVTWLGARLAMSGSITPGELVACYGVSAFLVLPVSTATETVHAFSAALVGAGRVTAILNLSPDLWSPVDPVPLPDGPLELRDETTGLVCPAGRLTVVVVGGRTSALVDRLGRFADPDGSARTLAGGVDLRTADLAEVRRRILVAHNQDVLFSGILADELALTAGSSVTVPRAVWAADATDVIDSLPAGLDSWVAERGRTLSGGQRQRLALARALTADPDVLVLEAPTSAVDAHTEARIARRVADSRRGRTTVVCTDSPLWIEVADRVERVRER